MGDKIDKGETADKISAPDPATAPLGTDDEAAGVSPSPRDVVVDHVASNPKQPTGLISPKTAIVVVSVVVLVIGLSIWLAGL